MLYWSSEQTLTTVVPLELFVRDSVFIYLILLTTTEKIHKAVYLAINSIMVQQIHIHHISLQQFDIMEVYYKYKQ